VTTTKQVAQPSGGRSAQAGAAEPDARATCAGRREALHRAPDRAARDCYLASTERLWPLTAVAGRAFGLRWFVVCRFESYCLHQSTTDIRAKYAASSKASFIEQDNATL